MDLSITREPVYVSEVLFDGQAEQGVEFDYVLPDYYPDIFKILRCTLKPGIVSYNVSGDKLTCDGIVYITVLYLSENSSKLHCVEHRYTYSKTIDLPRSTDNASVVISTKTDYCSCRAVSGRRLDVRGAVSFKIKVTCGRFAEIITAAEGCGVQTKKTAAVYGGKKIRCEKQFVVREEIEAAESKGAVKAVINCDTVSVVSDCKVISDKVVVKGEAKLKALYLCDNGEESTVHTMEADIPLSQIIDIMGITDKHTCYAQFKILSCDISPKQTEQDGAVIFGCEMTVGAYVSAGLEETIYPVTDMYSTEFESSFETVQLRTDTNPVYISDNCAIKETLECTDGEPESVIDCRCELSNITCRVNNGSELLLSGQAAYQALVMHSGGLPSFLEKTVPFELTVQTPLSPSDSNEYSVDPFVQVTNTMCSMSGDTRLEIRAGISVQGCFYRSTFIDVIGDMTVDESAPKHRQDDYYLKLYFMQEGEDIWSIAKRYNTSAEAVMSENSSDDGGNMLLIPII